MRAAQTGVGVLLLAALVRAGDCGEVDDERSAWRYRRAVVFEESAAAAPGFGVLEIPPEVMSRARPDLRDLRLVGEGGRETPYVVEARDEGETAARWSGLLADVRREARVQSVWTLDLGEPRQFDRVVLTIPGSGFAKRAQADVSTDGRHWRTVLRDAGVFDRPWTPPVHHATLVLPEAASARYLRLLFDDRRSRPVDVTRVEAVLVERRPGERWRQFAALTPLPEREGVSRYRVEAPQGLSFQELRLESDDLAFSRRVWLVEALERNGRRQERKLGSGVLYRLRLPEEQLAGEAVSLELVSSEGGERILEVEDGDSPPLRRPRLEVSGPIERLVFPASSGLRLYYGNETTRAPLYDLASLRERLGQSRGPAPAGLGPEAENPRYRKPAPLPFAALIGAQLAVERWARVRPLAVRGPEDLYTLTLGAADLAVLRRDLGDLRLADEAGRQLPYILEAEASEARIEMALASDPAGRPRQEAGTSRYRLAPAGPALGRASALPLRALELDFDAAFFSRPVRLLVPAQGARRGERVVFSGTLAREASSAGPLRIALDGSRVAELVLEVEEGDNAPLTLRRAAGVVAVPRLVFKAAAGPYRLLLGNAEAAPPSYDLASLRREVLAYSAVGVEVGPADDNPAFSRRPWERLGDAPSTLLLWGALGGSVIALLLLTARILRQPPAGG